ncbi:hypothetical protein G6F36_008163 [Rhizopus arrhizus]|nr:hypothetical protein G6F36_008163 [Rhizopus arrhizus]
MVKQKALIADLLLPEIERQLAKDDSIWPNIKGLYIIQLSKKKNPVAVWATKFKVKKVKIQVEDHDLLNFITGGMTGVKAYVAGRIKVRGDLVLAQRLEEVFEKAGGRENEKSCQQTCSEPKLDDIIRDVKSFSVDQVTIEYAITEIMDNIEALKTPRALEKFLTNLAYLVDREDMEEEYDNQILFQKESVFGLFIRKAHSEFLTLPANRLHDLFMAFSEYCSNCPKDTFLFDSTSRQGWISEHNISEFLRSQAEMIESGVLHTFLRNVEQHASGIPYTHQVKYLNYARSKEHVNSVYHLHAYFNSSINKGVGVQYALLNLGILEYKFGHSTSALFAFNDALTAARQNNDEYCLQEIQYWINACRKSHAFHDYSVFTDHYLHNMKELKYARDMICKGGPNQHIFKTLYKTSINIIMKDIENMDRVQNLTTTLAWLRCGNSVLASSYLELAKNSNDGRVEDIEKTVLVNAKMVDVTFATL